MRFLVDENLPFSLTKLLRNLGHDVLDIVEASLRGTSDEKLWQIAAQQKRILITKDLGFSLPSSPPSPFGIILIRVPDTFTSSLIINLLDNSLKTIKSEELEGHITHNSNFTRQGAIQKAPSRVARIMMPGAEELHKQEKR